MNPDERSAMVEVTMRPEIERAVNIAHEIGFGLGRDEAVEETLEGLDQAIADLEAQMLPLDARERVARWFGVNAPYEWDCSMESAREWADSLLSALTTQSPASDRAEVCPRCRGTGKSPTMSDVDCGLCDGAGTLKPICVSASGEPGGSEGK